MRRPAFTILLAVGLWAAAPAIANSDREASVQDVTAVQNGEGETRIFFRVAEIPFSSQTVVLRATLRLPYSGASEERMIPLRVHPVTEA